MLHNSHFSGEEEELTLRENVPTNSPAKSLCKTEARSNWTDCYEKSTAIS